MTSIDSDIDSDFAASDSDAQSAEQRQAELEAELHRTQLALQMAHRSEQFKAGFLARTSHELRSPLNSVMSLQQLILSDLCEDAAEEREFVEQAYAASQKMLGLLDHLIGVSKAVYGTEKFQLQPVLLEDVFMEVQSLTMMQAQNRSQRLEIIYPDPDVTVLADPRWLRQTLVSLVDTPIALMQEGFIHLSATAETDVVYLQIEDERPASFWSEPIDLLQTLQSRNQLHTTEAKPDLATLTNLEQVPSPGLTLLVSQTVLELMGGSLEVLAVPSNQQAKSVIRCTLKRSED